MNSADNLKSYFEQLKAMSLQNDARIYGTGLWKSWNKLAIAHYEPAKEFFIERLQDSRSDWRRASLGLLGFDYELESETLDKIRGLLLEDSDSGVRISAASVLGNQGRFPEKSLLHALAHDSDSLVRKSAFSALLELASVPYKVKGDELKKIRSKKITPSLEQVMRILREQNKFTEISILEETKDE
jgi:HEAT repeat protein